MRKPLPFTGGFHQLLARQFTRPSGLLGRLLIAPWLNRSSRRHNRLILERLGVRTGEHLAEVGFGGGALMQLALNAGAAKVTGVDPSPDMLERAQRRFRREVDEGRLRLAEGTASRLPLVAGEADAAASLHNIYFWSDPAAAIAEFARILKPGGRTVIGFEPSAYMRRWPGHRHGFRLWDAQDVAALLEEGGFTGVWSDTRTGAPSLAMVGGRR